MKTYFERYAKWIPILEASGRRINPTDNASLIINQRCIDCIKEMNKDVSSRAYYEFRVGEFKGLMYALKAIEDNHIVS